MTAANHFELLGRDRQARTGRLMTPHGVVRTPAFMPVGTAGAMKGMHWREVREAGADVVLGNTYHLMLRPGAERIAALGGLRAFTRWPHVMLTDSGGFQAYSLAQPLAGSSLVAAAEDGFSFKSHLDGSQHALTPELAVTIQGQIGADIQMQLDVCSPGDSPRADVEQAVARTSRWALRALRTPRPPGQALFGIVQGACFADLRKAHAEELAALAFDGSGFDGLALGGFSVGEPVPRMYEALAACAPSLDPERPRYLMGVGTPRDLVVAMGAGVDMFDCVLPTRNARNGQALTRF